MKKDVLEEKIKNIEKAIDKYERNHFPSIMKRLNKIERKQAYWSGGLVVIIPIASYFLNKLFL